MKKATFKAQDNKTTIYGTVTLKDDGKVSISIQNASYLSYMDRYTAKKVANEIVAADFKHPAILQFEESNKGVEVILRSYTVELKADYIAKCRTWEARAYENAVAYMAKIKALGRRTEEWFNYFSIPFITGMYHGKMMTRPATDKAMSAEYKANNMLDAKAKYIAAGLDANVDAAEKNAIAHYNHSIAKLAAVIEKKGMDIEKMKLVTSGIGVNIEILLTDGNIKVKAQTIFAEGMINRPHYRYLVK